MPIKNINIIFDSNLFAREHGLISFETKDLILKYINNEKANFHFYVSDVVYWEELNHFKRNALREISSYRDRVETLKKIVDRKLVDLRYDDEYLNRMFKKISKESHIQILNTNWDIIDLKKLVQQACAQEAPFNQGIEGKGFKDALIVANYLQYKNSKFAGENNINILACNDGQINMALDMLHDNTIQQSTSLEDLKTTIGLILQDINKTAVNNLKAEAAKLFSQKFMNDDLFSRVLTVGEPYLNNPQRQSFYVSFASQKKYTRSGELTFSQAETNFKRMYRTRRFGWETEILVTGKYKEAEKTSLSSIISAPSQQMADVLASYIKPINEISSFLNSTNPSQLETQNNDYEEQICEIGKEGEYSFFTKKEPQERTFYFVFTIKWSVALDSNDKPINERILSVDFKEQRYRSGFTNWGMR